MLITKFLAAVTLTTYLCIIRCHSMQIKYNSVDSDKSQSNRNPADNLLSSASITTGTRQSSHSSLSLSPAQQQPHRHRHKHNMINHRNNSTTNNSSTNNNPISASPDKTVTSTHDYALYSRCSGGYLEFYRGRINALGQLDSRFALMSLEIQSYGSGIGVRILSKNAGVYLCFNKTGRLISRYNADNSVGCLFKEVPHARYIKFMSLYNPDWFVGFNKNGRPISGRIRVASDSASSSSQRSPHHRKHRERCYHFVKKVLNTSKQAALDSSHETYNYHSDISSYYLKAESRVINTESNRNKKTNEKLAHLLTTGSQLLVSTTEMGTNIKTINSHSENFPMNSDNNDEDKVKNDYKSLINVNFADNDNNNNDFKINRDHNHNRNHHRNHRHHQPLR